MPRNESDDETRTANSPDLSFDLKPESVPDRIGRYLIKRVLGRGGFGLVYLAQDERLSRRVAVKVPHSNLISKLEDAEAYLNEARAVAILDHPNIVPVYDVGSTEAYPCFIVSKYIEGADLAKTLKHHRLDCVNAAELIATVADAQHHAHKQGLVHRDVKPGNILIDTEGIPFLVDFGLALREGDTRNKKRYAGTPAYMSPEQARGEGHRVDGRSDIFSLGVVFYELLVGRKPFRGDSREELLEQVTSHDPRPPRQYDEKLPKELERICSKAMAKRASERYSSAYDFAEDLRHFLSAQMNSHTSSTSMGITAALSATHESEQGTTAGSFGSSTPDSAAPISSSHSQAIPVVPKGLRSFDANDSDFFLDLLPGPRDRDGLPDSLRFWKSHIEVVDPDNTFSVGVIYGPSGCGKSSLVKAGLLPRLSSDVISVYVESAPQETELRLLSGLRKRCPKIDTNLNLKETITALRQGHGLPVEKKVLIIVDQFEQWLHSRKDEKNTELVQALRQCDGGRVQCIVMVRDDFWMALTRFLDALEVDLIQGGNFAVVDLFPVRHARRVLAAFGRAYQALPENAVKTTPEQHEFIKQSVDGLTEEGKVISVRLALFAEMMKGKVWALSTLKAVGGTAGVGVTFLDETFSAQSNPKHRIHEKAARSVLKSLLPQSGTNIKGNMKSRSELMEASDCTNRPKEFDDLIRILDGEIRLITPTDPSGLDTDSSVSGKGVEKYYQLTHDYLIPSLRDWLTRKQKETRRGRAEILLADRSTIWDSKPENRLLPSWWEYLHIRFLTDSNSWTESQRRMTRQAGRIYSIRLATFVSILVLVVIAGFAIASRVEDQRTNDVAQSLVARVMDAEIGQVPTIVKKIDEYRKWIDGPLREEFSQAKDRSPEKLRLGLALLPVDNEKVGYLTTALIDADAPSLPVIRDALKPHQDSLLPALWKLLQSESEPADRRFNAAAVLATYDTEARDKWNFVAPFVAEQLVETLTRNPRDFASILKSTEPIHSQLTDVVAAIVRDGNRGELQRETALNVALEYSAADPNQLSELLAYSEQWQFNKILEQLRKQEADAVPFLTKMLQERWTDETPETNKERIAKRQANAAVALLRFEHSDEVLPLLKHLSDPRSQSYLIHWAAPLGVDPQFFVQRIGIESESSMLRTSLLAVGEFNDTQVSLKDRIPLIAKLLEIYGDHPDSGVHGCSEWLLRKWELNIAETSTETDPDQIRNLLLNAGHQKTVQELTNELQTNENDRQRVMRSGRRRWYVTSQGHTFAMLNGDTFLMGSANSEPGRTEEREQRHRRRIDRKFAISMHEVTRDQYSTFHKENESTIKILRTDQYSLTGDSPQLAVSWYDAAAYCNWLSSEEGIHESQWCYEKNAEGKYAEGMKAKDNYLELTGYRLPTEAEWEFACRSGTTTSRYYGLSETLLDKYARFRQTGSEALPVGRLKPNSFGLFDMLGNAMEWCNEEEVSYPDGSEGSQADSDDAVVKTVSDADPRVLRGGAFLNLAPLIRSANRVYYGPANRYYTLGFRPARTMH